MNLAGALRLGTSLATQTNTRDAPDIIYSMPVDELAKEPSNSHLISSISFDNVGQALSVFRVKLSAFKSGGDFTNRSEVNKIIYYHSINAMPFLQATPNDGCNSFSSARPGYASALS